MDFSLRQPSRGLLPSYIAALETGWSASTLRDISGEQLAAIRTDDDAFLTDLNRPGAPITLPNGRQVPRLPGCLLWMWDGEFCGSINFRHLHGTEELPEHVSGHIGYAVVPSKQRHGYATRALALMLPIAAKAGLSRVLLTCDDDNIASRKVIEANHGSLAVGVPIPEQPNRCKLHFWVPTPRLVTTPTIS
jgi:predicted acetyltransferase